MFFSNGNQVCFVLEERNRWNESKKRWYVHLHKEKAEGYINCTLITVTYTQISNKTSFSPPFVTMVTTHVYGLVITQSCWVRLHQNARVCTRVQQKIPVSTISGYFYLGSIQICAQMHFYYIQKYPYLYPNISKSTCIYPYPDTFEKYPCPGIH